MYIAQHDVSFQNAIAYHHNQGKYIFKREEGSGADKVLAKASNTKVKKNIIFGTA